jgi:hypothetical protein
MIQETTDHSQDVPKEATMNYEIIKDEATAIDDQQIQKMLEDLRAQGGTARLWIPHGHNARGVKAEISRVAGKDNVILRDEGEFVYVKLANS